MVRSISGKAATKTYRCPGCHHEIPPGTPHVVAWAAGGAERSSSWGTEDLNSDDEPERRHWHTGCWRRRRA